MTTKIPTGWAWCDEHDLPMRNMRTPDDRIVCWFLWWLDAMEQAHGPPNGPAVGEDGRPAVASCRPGSRIVIDCRVPA